MPEIILAFSRRDLIDELADAVGGLLDGSGIFLAEQGFEFGECLLDWVEVWAVGRQKNQLGAGFADGKADRAGFVTAKIIHHHDVTRPQGGHQELDHPGQEALAIDRAIEHTRGHDPVAS